MLAIARTYKSRMEARPFVRQIMPRRRKRCEKRFSRNLCSAVASMGPGRVGNHLIDLSRIEAGSCNRRPCLQMAYMLRTITSAGDPA